MAPVDTCLKLALCALLSITFALPDAEQKQDKFEITELVNDEAGAKVEQLDESIVDMRGNYWIPCDYTATPSFSCLDCHTRLICKPYGGIVKQCGLKYCRNGYCSGIPSEECA